MSLIGKEIGEFKVQSFVNNEFKEVTKEDVLGKWAVFFFYPADFTFVCPTELEDLADKYEDFKKIGCEIYSVSCDTHFVHKAWHDVSKTIQKIQYPMLADPTGALARDFDVMIESDGLAERGSFIVNPEGKIVAYEVIAGNVGRNAEELFRRVQASQFVAEHGDEVCPAKWKPGEETLKPSLNLVGLLSYERAVRRHRRGSGAGRSIGRPLRGEGKIPGPRPGKGENGRADHHYIGDCQLSRRGEDGRH